MSSTVWWSWSSTGRRGLVVRDQQYSGKLPRGLPADTLAGALVAIVPGFILQLTMLGPTAVDGVPDAVRALWP